MISEKESRKAHPISKNSEHIEYDVIVVGSGAAGGMAAYVSTLAGAKTLMLESGRDYDPATETPMFNLAEEAPLHAASTPDKAQGFFDATVGGGWDVPGEPYTVSEGSRFQWWRARMLGGRTNHWGRLSLRFGPYDFIGKSRDGLGVDWPIRYEDVAPYYDKVETLIGLFGAAEGIENSPDSPKGVLQPPPKMRTHERWLQMYLGEKHGVPVVPAHMAILTQPLNNRPACFYATDCLRGCSIGANFQSPTVLIPPAADTGNLSIITGAHVYEVSTDSSGRATGVRYINRETGEHHQVKARAVVLGASTCETARILLNSKSNAHPEGLGNSSGQVGRNLMDTVKIGAWAQIPALEDIPPFNDEGVTLFQAYSPWWDYDGMRAGKYDFSRGYHLEFWGGRLQPTFSDMEEIATLSGSIGSNLRDDMRRLYGSFVYMSASGEMLPNRDTYCELDPEVKDQWGLPVLRFHWKHKEHDHNTVRHMSNSLEAFFSGMNANILTDLNIPVEESIRAGGSVIHETSSCRMGADRETSATDRWSRLWDAKNVYIADASVFSSNPDKNPTLTIMALAWRACEHMCEGLRRNEI